MLKTIIIDDEPGAIEAISEILKLYCKNVHIIAKAENVKSGIEAIYQNKPDLVLLDIKMPDGTGFDLLRQLDSVDFKVIFITAYEEYATKAFKFSAIDYILKPIDPDELIKAIEKAEQLPSYEDINLKLNAFLSNIGNISKEVKKIVLYTSESIHLVNVQDIIRCEADRNYTLFYFNDRKKLMISKTLKEFDELLGEYGFFRTHHSHLVNIDYIKQYRRHDDHLVMTDESLIPVAFSKKKQLLELFKKM